jgi:hypothetical protein
MTSLKQPEKSNVGAILFLFFAAAGGVGLALDNTLSREVSFWIGERPGGAAALGAGAAVFAVAAGFCARAALSRRARDKGRGDVRART